MSPGLQISDDTIAWMDNISNRLAPWVLACHLLCNNGSSDRTGSRDGEILTLNSSDVLDRGVPLLQIVCTREGDINAVEEAQQVARLSWPTRALALVIPLNIGCHHALVCAGNLQERDDT